MEDINGFLIVSEIWINEKNQYKCNALCKACNKEFTTNYHALHRMKSCGCARPIKLKPLPNYINGFKTIKCHGYDKVRGVGWATVECKECKKEYEVDPNKLQYRKHCGCRKKDVISCQYAKSHPQLAQTIKHMMSRCYNKNNKDYYNYGARGITVCNEWIKDRNLFCEWAIGNGFQEGKNLSIDRIDNSKGYFPENCRWSDATQQSRNTRRTILTMKIANSIRKEKGMTQKELSEKYGVSKGAINLVLHNKTWKE